MLGSSKMALGATAEELGSSCPTVAQADFRFEQAAHKCNANLRNVANSGIINNGNNDRVVVNHYHVKSEETLQRERREQARQETFRSQARVYSARRKLAADNQAVAEAQKKKLKAQEDKKQASERAFAQANPKLVQWRQNAAIDQNHQNGSRKAARELEDAKAALDKLDNPSYTVIDGRGKRSVTGAEAKELRRKACRKGNFNECPGQINQRRGPLLQTLQYAESNYARYRQ